ncbi:hypothetical protein GGI20_004226 [Coemansia sp. BCRC 34301]|nr:hypothetical protein GGI20_004226 [Coemansia sp. BCRC 34301]
MTTEAEREKRVEAIERRLAGSSGATNEAVSGGESSAGHNPKAASSKGASKRSKFPGSGRTIGGDTVEGDEDEDADEPEDGEGDFEGDAGSDFDEEYLSEDDEDDGEDAYDSEEEESAVRGGSATYNLRAPSSKRKHASEIADSDDEGTGPSLRTRQKVAPRRSTAANDDSEDEEDDDDEEDGAGSDDDNEEDDEEGDV